MGTHKYRECIKPLKNCIIVSCNPNQKDEAVIGGNILKTGKNYNENFRERNPVVAFVKSGTKEIPTQSYIICNYSHFDLESPFEFSQNLYSIPVNEEIYAIVNKDGSLTPVCGNVIVEQVTKETKIDLPKELKKAHVNQGIAKTGEFKDKYIFWLPFANYEIVYTWNSEEKRAIKIHHTEITGYLK